jgi:hypothetical protein
MHELKISERMRPHALKVEPGMLVAVVLILVATHLINAYSVGGTQRIHLALQYIFAEEKGKEMLNAGVLSARGTLLLGLTYL